MIIALIAVIWFATAACSKTGASTPSSPGTRSAAPEIPGMVWIPAGTFTMGSPESEPGRFISETYNETQHQVRLSKGFYIGKYPVTQAQYQAVMKTNPSNFKNSSGGDNPANRPVEMVSWYDAIVFCNRLSMEEGLKPAYRINRNTNPSAWGKVPESNDPTWNAVEIVADSNGYRLPTEAQWEYACRAGTTTAFNWGADKISWDSLAGINIRRTTEVGTTYVPNAWGLYDMHGNVWEWCWDWFGVYESGTQTDPTGTVSGYSRVLRGGSWNISGYNYRSATRNRNSPSYRYYNIGFRLIR